MNRISNPSRRRLPSTALCPAFVKHLEGGTDEGGTQTYIRPFPSHEMHIRGNSVPTADK